MTREKMQSLTPVLYFQVSYYDIIGKLRQELSHIFREPGLRREESPA
jgi:hypothetical protein